MLKKLFVLFFSAIVMSLSHSESLAQILFSSDFEAFTVGEQLVCQDSSNWTTWNQNPCDPSQDPLISNNHSHSGSNSVIIVQDNDLIKPLGSKTSGIWAISFMLYIPSGKDGYFNCMSRFFTMPRFWALQVAFNNDGSGICADGTGPPPTQFTYSQDQWIVVRIEIDLNSDSAKFSLDNNLIFNWQWTNGNGPLQLDVVNFYGDVSTFEMYIDDFMYDQITSIEIEDKLPTDFTLIQNYPNPFNPSTKIKYELPQRSDVTIKVFNLLGSELKILINEEQEAGSYEVEFNASNLPSGVYFYQLRAGDFVETKKMILLK